MPAKPNQYKIPAALHAKAAWSEVWFGFPQLGVVIAATAAAVAYNGIHDPGSWAMLGLTVVNALVLVWAFRWAWKNRAVMYEVGGVTCIWAAHEWYVPPDEYERFMRYEAWDPFNIAGGTGANMTQGVAMLYVGDKPYAPAIEKDGQLVIKRVWGATYPWSRYSLVGGERRLDTGVDGHELRLHCCHFMFPGRSEEEDVEWMKRKGIPR